MGEVIFPNHYTESKQAETLTLVLGDEDTQLSQEDQDYLART